MRSKSIHGSYPNALSYSHNYSREISRNKKKDNFYICTWNESPSAVSLSVDFQRLKSLRYSGRISKSEYEKACISRYRFLAKLLLRTLKVFVKKNNITKKQFLIIFLLKFYLKKYI